MSRSAQKRYVWQTPPHGIYRYTGLPLSTVPAGDMFQKKRQNVLQRYLMFLVSGILVVENNRDVYFMIQHYKKS